MQTEYLVRLSEPVQQLIAEVERRAGIFIPVITDASLDSQGPLGIGILAVEITPERTRLHAPTNGYFPDGAVHHEILHIRRFLVEGVPQIVLAETAPYDQGLATMFTDLDNAIEHLVIVPEELTMHPDRRQHWELIVKEIWSEAETIPAAERPLAVGMHWTFMRHVLSTSPQIKVARDFMEKHGLMADAERFADQILKSLAQKEQLILHIVKTFPEKPWGSAEQRYMRRGNGFVSNHQTRDGSSTVPSVSPQAPVQAIKR